ncbi:hypothetical protein BCR39DRAFT_74251 [Naematelia encephala]|uniref:Uncharacterized protein n=1 Tax=Naematelia encephala TaxID=71784 RepID=A0A1Y2AEE1_9TREE|nr:hypothetical protein BCR39DRAFT_74251 [Naematelia encephala]
MVTTNLSPLIRVHVYSSPLPLPLSLSHAPQSPRDVYLFFTLLLFYLDGEREEKRTNPQTQVEGGRSVGSWYKKKRGRVGVGVDKYKSKREALKREG